MTLAGGRHTGVGLRGPRSGCRIADDTGEVDAQGIARSDQVRFTLDNGPSRLRLACPFGANSGLTLAINTRAATQFPAFSTARNDPTKRKPDQVANLS